MQIDPPQTIEDIEAQGQVQIAQGYYSEADLWREYPGVRELEKNTERFANQELPRRVDQIVEPVLDAALAATEDALDAAGTKAPGEPITPWRPLDTAISAINALRELYRQYGPFGREDPEPNYELPPLPPASSR